MMNFDELIARSRSIRRFYEDEPVTLKTLRELADYARLSPSSGNIQGVKLYLSCTPDKNALIFKNLRWAFYLKDWDGPAEGERPAAYIIVLWDTEIREPIDTDTGIAVQSIMLGAVSKGYGGCIIGSIDRAGLRKDLKIPERFSVSLALALGKPREKVVIDRLPDNHKVEYWRDTFSTHHVPKRDLDDLIFTAFS